MIPKKAFILLNGAEPSVFPDLTMYDFVCAIDGAYNHFEKNNIAQANPTIIDQMKLIAKQQHMHPQVLEWEFIDPKIKKANSK